MGKENSKKGEEVRSAATVESVDLGADVSGVVWSIHLSRRARWLVSVLLVLSVIGMFGIGALVGNAVAQRQYVAATLKYNALETAIMAWVTERNPEARIRDFNGFVPALFAAAAESGLEWELILAVADIESQMRPDAVSPKGAVGLMQIMPETGKFIADKLKDDTYIPPKPKRVGGYESLGSLGDARVSLRYGALFLRWRRDQFRQWPTALRAYNRSEKSATSHWPYDRYAEDVVFAFLALRDRFGEVKTSGYKRTRM